MQRARPTNYGGIPASLTARIDHWEKYFIYMVPAHMKAQNSKAYTPHFVSIGPYHHGEPDLVAMEVHKVRALQRFLDRSQKSYRDCCEVLGKSYADLVISYQSLSAEWKAATVGRFLQLMVLDGVFLYELMRGIPDGWDYDEKDPIFSLRAWLYICPYILPDILMLENQLPLTVLERLIAFEKGQLDQQHHPEVYKLVFKFLSADIPSNMPPQVPGLHILDVSRKVITREFEQIPREKRKPALGVKSAKDLHGAGVNFRKSEILGNGGISFEKGTLTLPPLTFDTTTEPLFLNAIAFECLHPAANREVSSYIAFMRGLIASPDDATYLMSLDLIQSNIGDEQAVAALMKNISKNVLFDPLSDLCKVRDSVNKYYEVHMGEWRRRLRDWWSTLLRIYLKNPWTITAVVAAAFILILTLLQTIYSVKSYFKN